MGKEKKVKRKEIERVRGRIMSDLVFEGFEL